MERTAKRAFAVLLSFIMLLSAVQLAGIISYAENMIGGACGDDLTWALDLDTGVLTISGTGDMANYGDDTDPGFDLGDAVEGDVDDPEDPFDGIPVTESADENFVYPPWVYSSSVIRTVVIEDGVTGIGNYAFLFCTELTSVTIPDSVTTIGHYAFFNCIGLISVTVGDGVTSIGSGAFENCFGLNYAHVPSTVTSIGDDVFNNMNGSFYICSETNDCCAKAYAEANGIAFRQCGGHVAINTISGNCGYQGDNMTWTLDLITGEMVISGTDRMEHYSDYSNKAPWDKYRSIIKTVTVEDGVENIGGLAFYNCAGLTSVTISDSVTSIGNRAFANCTGIAEVCYAGSAANWANISFGNNNNYLTKANIYYGAFTVTFLGEDGSVLSTRTVTSGAAATAPAAPQVKDKFFTGWDVDFSNVTSDLTVTAQYEESVKEIRADGKYYINGEAVPKYYGLIEYEGDYYYIKDSTRIVRNKTIHISNTNGLKFPDGTPIPNGFYEFDADGKLVFRNGIQEDGRYYINGVSVPSYYGLVEWEGDLYYIRDNAQIVRSKSCYINTTNGLTLPNGKPVQHAYYEFDADGKLMMKQGVQANGKYYIDDVAVPSYYGLVEWEGDFYYIKDNARVVRSRICYVNTANGLTYPNGTPVQKGNYEFDADGKMIVKQGVQADGKYYIYGSAVPSYYGLVEDGGCYYYIKDNAQIVRSKTIRINTTNGLTFPGGTPIPKGNYEFDADGRMLF